MTNCPSKSTSKKRNISLTTASADETVKLGRILSEKLRSGDVLALSGELGAGKTCLTQGIARGLGVSDSYAVTSPTFTLVNEYPGRQVLYHLDVYRLSGSRDLEEMGYEEYFYGKGITIIEWAEKISDILPDETITLIIKFLDENMRRIEISSQEDRLEEISAALREGGFE
jgi:tRNA threonylcarbamoyladenosine biosynthesis protein TsaE